MRIPSGKTASNRRYYLKNSAKIRARAQEWYEQNKERHRLSGKAWRKKNRDKERAYQAAKYVRCREMIRAKTRAYKKIERAKNSQFLTKYKLDHGCTDCGYKAHVDALEFDHVKPKRWPISNLLGSTKRLYDELTRCEVVCANCHAIRTQNRRRAGVKERANT